MPNGQHTVEIVAEDTAGYIATTSLQLNVVGQEPGALNLQESPNWTSCSAVIGATIRAPLVWVLRFQVCRKISPHLPSTG